MTSPAEGGYDIERSSVRVVLLDAAGAVLLFRTIDPAMPESGTWWELPGGGVEAGESAVDTAVREVLEDMFRTRPLYWPTSNTSPLRSVPASTSKVVT